MVCAKNAEVDQITVVSHEVNELVASIAAAVKEQGLSTKDVAQNVAYAATTAATASKALAEDMTTIRGTSTETGGPIDSSISMPPS